MSGGVVLVQGPPQGRTMVLLTTGMGLVAVATVVGTVWSGQVVGLLLGAPPLSIYFGIHALEEVDPQGSIAVLVITALALGTSVVSWALTSVVTQYRRETQAG